MLAGRTTVGLDVGDRHSQFCILDEGGEIVAEGRLRTTAETMNEHFTRWARSRVVLEPSSSLAEFGDILTPAEVQRLLGIGRNATYDLLASGRLPAIRITPRRLIVTKKALEAFLGLAANIPSAGTP